MDAEVMNTWLPSCFGIMTLNQATFDCCKANPLLLFALPEGDNGFAVPLSCTCDPGCNARGVASKCCAKEYAILSH